MTALRSRVERIDRLKLAAKRPSLDSFCRCLSIIRIREFTARGSCVTLSYDMEWGAFAMGTLTIRLDDKLERELARLAKQTGRSKSEVAREALRRQLAIQKFRALRREAMPYAAAAGYLTDEDVFRAVS